MKTEREFLSQNELTSEELESVVDVTEYLLNSIEHIDTFGEEFDPSQPSQVIKYKEEIEKFPFDYKNQNIEAFEKPYLGDIFWGDDKGVVVETIKFSPDDQDISKKHIYFSIKEACHKLVLSNTDLLYTPNYQNFSKAVEYLSEDITSKESLKRFLENPGYSFIYNDKGQYSFPSVKAGEKRISFHKKNINLSQKEKSSIEGWQYIEVFELLKFAPIVDRSFFYSYVTKIVENSLRNRSIDKSRGDRGVFTHFNYRNSSILMIITKGE